LASRTLVKGEALSPPAGRADDFVWPRREVGREQAKEPPKDPNKEQVRPDTPMAATTPGDPASSRQQPPKRTTTPGQTQQPTQVLRDFFGLSAPAQPKPPAQRTPGTNGQRAQGNAGRAAAAQDQPAPDQPVQGQSTRSRAGPVDAVE
jgi:hypothetical protein